jgi:hypothetical protein
MPSRFKTLAALAFTLCACGRASTPEGLVQSWLEAAVDGDASAFRAAFPSKDEVADLFVCPEGLSLDDRFDAPNPDFAAWRNGRPTLAGTTRVAAEPVASGTPVGGCNARRDLELLRMDATLVEGGVERTLRLRLVAFDGRHRILGY